MEKSKAVWIQKMCDKTYFKEIQNCRRRRSRNSRGIKKREYSWNYRRFDEPL